jgi:hypothetical protein
MFNSFFVVEFIFYSLIFFIHYKKKAFRQISLLFIPLILAFALLNTFFWQGLNKNFASYTTLFGSFFIVLFACFFYYESILPEQIDNQLARQPFFWICSGLLIFYLGSVIVNALFEYLVYNDLAKQGVRIYLIILHSLNVVLYSSFCIGFYLCPDSKKIY